MHRKEEMQSEPKHDGHFHCISKYFCICVHVLTPGLRLIRRAFFSEPIFYSATERQYGQV